MGLYGFTFYDLINVNAICFKEKKACFDIENSRYVTFAQYKEKVERLPTGLKKLGIRGGAIG
ncbi:MAG: hypothetical protein KAV87_47800 [Desulfobacteraceae bacterium]|nr:hypothetical protein [Desulfobacteraceae bacterium]